MSEKPKRTHPAPPGPVLIHSLAQAEALTRPLDVEVNYCGQAIRFAGRRLRPCESLEVKLLLEAALPPELPPEKEGGDVRYDFRNPEYLRQKEGNQREARAFALCAAYPVFAEGYTAWLKESGRAPSRAAQREFIESRPFDEDLLQVLFQAVVAEVLGLEKRVLFR